jgi:site-specific DNA recombinase
MTATSNDHKVRVALYARVSGEEQTIGKNIGSQVDELKGSQPPSHEVVGIYLDDGVSGAVPLADRPEGSRLMADATAGRFDRLMVNRLDRLSRSIVDLNHIAKTLDALGIVLWAQGQEFGQTSMGKFMLNSLGALAEFERDIIKDRTLSGKRFKAKALGRWPGGTVPYGYAYYKGEPGEEGRWEIIEPEAEVIRRVYAMCVQHDQGVSAIADSLSDEGVPTPSAVRADPKHPRAKPNCRVGKRWERSHISRMLRNPTYIGKPLVAVDGERKDISPGELVHLLRTGEWQQKGLIQLQVPAVVDESLWWEAQDKLEARKRLPNTHYEAWPLQGQVTCAADGRVFKCRRNGQKGRRVYSCAGREGRAQPEGSHRCKAPRLDAEQLESAVFWNLKELLSRPKAGRKAIEEYLSRLEAMQEEAGGSLTPILRSLGELDEREKRIDDLYDWGRLSAEEFQARLDSVLTARRILEVKRSTRQRDIDEFDTRRREIEQIRAAIAEDRFNITWSPSKNKLRIALFREPDVVGEPFDFADGGEAEFRALQPRKKKPSKAVVMTHGRGSERFDAAAFEARFETEYDIRRLFELFDIKVVVHDDFIEVRGAFSKPMTTGLEEMGEVALLRSSTGTIRRGRLGGRSRSLPPRRAPALWDRSSAARGQWRRRTGRP